jgi:hypothetical protein
VIAIESFLPITYQTELKNIIAGYEFPWSWQDNQIDNTLDTNQISGFGHVFLRDELIHSKYFNLIQPIVYFFEEKTNLKVKRIYRAQANLLVNQITTQEMLNSQIHIDNENDNFYSLVYYVIDSDGNTKLYNNKKDKEVVMSCEPKEGNACIFKSNTYHSATLPKINKKRIVLNFIFEIYT